MNRKKQMPLPYERRQQVCGTKVRYATIPEAQRYIREFASKSNPLGYYKCPVCGGFHITSNP